MNGRREAITALGWIVLLALVLPGRGFAQYDPASPTTTTAEERERFWGPFEAGGNFSLQFLFLDTNGSREKYRTDSNYLSGVNLGEFSLRLHSRDARWLDYFNLRSEGFGDAYPHEQASLVFGKRKRYEFRGLFRKQDQFFSLPAFALGGRGEDSARRLTDLSLRIFPIRNVTLELGYSRNNHFGTSYSSAGEFQRLFELRDPRRSLTQDFRVGGTVRGGPVLLRVVQSYRHYKDDPEASENRLLQAEGTLPGVRSSMPVRLSVPSTSILLSYRPSDRWEIEGRYAYSDGHVEAGQSEFLALQVFQGVSLEKILRAATTSDHPEHRYEIGATVQLTDHIAFSNTVEGERFQIDGRSLLTTTLRGTAPGTQPLVFTDDRSSSLEYALVGVRPRLEFFVDPRLSFYAGYSYSHRRVEQDDLSSRSVRLSHSAFAGTTFRPFRAARFSLEFEKGTANDAFTRIEPRDVTRVRLSSHIPILGGLSVDPHFVISDRESTTGDKRYDAKQRQGGVEIQYLHPDAKWMLSAGYALYDFERLADIGFFLAGNPIENVSAYSTHLHFFHSRAVLPLGRRATLNFGYQLLRDPSGSSYPLRRDRGEAGVSIRTFSHWIWDLRWQHISYNEDLLSSQDYAANLLSLGFRWSF